MAIEGRAREHLLDGPGAPGMSGGPVFADFDGELIHVGMYTGVIYPSRLLLPESKDTPLGTIYSLNLCWSTFPLKARAR
jgi:hypothetical protein